jgi:hypothetical protein
MFLQKMWSCNCYSSQLACLTTKCSGMKIVMVLFYSSFELEREMWWSFTIVLGCWGELMIPCLVYLCIRIWTNYMVFTTVADEQSKSLILCSGCHSVTVCMYALYVSGLSVVRFMVNRLIVRFSHDATFFLYQHTVYNHHATSFHAPNLCGLWVILNSLLLLNDLQEMQTWNYTWFFTGNYLT